MVNKPYSGHNHTSLSKSGVRYFQNLGQSDKYQGVHEKIRQWMPAVQGKHWSFISVQFINASFLCINFAENNEPDNQSEVATVITKLPIHGFKGCNLKNTVCVFAWTLDRKLFETANGNFAIRVRAHSPSASMRL
jgi:hypothetical protein